MVNGNSNVMEVFPEEAPNPTDFSNTTSSLVESSQDFFNSVSSAAQINNYFHSSALQSSSADTASRVVAKESSKSMVFDFSMSMDCETPMEVPKEEEPEPGQEVTRLALKEASHSFNSITSILAESGKDLTQLVSDMQDDEEEDDEEEVRSCSEEKGNKISGSLSTEVSSAVSQSLNSLTSPAMTSSSVVTSSSPIEVQPIC